MSFKSKSYRNLLVVTTTAVMLASFTFPSMNVLSNEGSVAIFSDVSNDAYYAEPIQYLVDKDMVKGYIDGTFKPKNELTRAEAANILATAIGSNTTNAANPNFSDVNEGDWFVEPVAALVEAGIINGYPDGSFKPNDTITRAEMAKMLVEAYPELEKVENPKVSFTDVREGVWHTGFIAALVDGEVTKGTTATTFAPNNPVTRGEAVTFVYRLEHAREQEEIVEENKDTGLNAGEGARIDEEANTDKDGVEIGEPVTLTLNSVLEKSLEDNSNLLILKYRAEIYEKQQKGAESDIEDYDDQIEETRDSPIPGVRGPLYDARNALLDRLEQLELQEKQSELQIEETKEAVRLFMTSRYIQLLSEQKQIDFSKLSKAWLESDLQVLKFRHQTGVASSEEIQNQERDIQSQTSTIEQDEDNFENELAKLLVDLNIPYTNQVTLESVAKDEVELIERPASIDKLVSDLYQIQIARENVKKAELDLEQNWYSGIYGRQQYRIQIDIAKEQLEQLKEDLHKQVNDIFNDARSLYTSYQDSLRNLSNLKEDQAKMQVRYEQGLVSKYDFEKMERGIKQAELQLELTKLNFYVIAEQIEALERGYIQ